MVNTIKHREQFPHLGKGLIYFKLDKVFRKGAFIQYGFGVKKSLRNFLALTKLNELKSK